MLRHIGASGTSNASCSRILGTPATRPARQQTTPLGSAVQISALAVADEKMLGSLQRSAFDYFDQRGRSPNGLVADTSRRDSPCSIAVVGFALSVYPVGIERGWITRSEGLQRCLTAMRFFWRSDQSGTTESSGCHGFYFHFLDMESGRRAWQCEVSIMDTALLLAGMLTAAAYFTLDSDDERELRDLATALYGRVEWTWAQRPRGAVVHGWKPESGFLRYRWQGYSEALLLYVLGLGSPTHPLSDTSFHHWTSTYQWEHVYGIEFLFAAPLFAHQFPHAWIDFRGIRDDFMDKQQSDYFENSRRATYVQREYAICNPRGFTGYGENCWGLSASDGPGIPRQWISGRRRSFRGYAARGVPNGPDDGTISGPATVASLAFAPEIVLPAIRQLLRHDVAAQGRAALASGFNNTVRPHETTGAQGATSGGWISDGTFGLDQGLMVLMIENVRSGMVWRLLRGSPPIRTGLYRAGFRGGWLTDAMR